MADGICGGVVPVCGSCPVCGGESDRYLLSHRRSGLPRLLRGSCCSDDYHRGAGYGRTTVPGIWSRLRVVILVVVVVAMWLLPLGSSPDTNCGSAFSTVIQNTRRIYSSYVYSTVLARDSANWCCRNKHTVCSSVVVCRSIN